MTLPRLLRRQVVERGHHLCRWRHLAVACAVLVVVQPAFAAQTTAINLSYAASWGNEKPGSSYAAFREWTEHYLTEKSQSEEKASQLIGEGQELAKVRRLALSQLIKTDPKSAIALSVPREVRESLPPQIQTELETRVSGLGDLSVIAVDGDNSGTIMKSVRIGGGTYRAYAYGRRAGQTTKRGIPLHGIALDGDLALHESSLEEITAGIAIESGKSIVDLSHRTQSQVEVFAEMGGVLYRFPSRAQLVEAERRIEIAETGFGPEPSKPATAVIESIAETTASPPLVDSIAWTTGTKNVLVIRIDFSDRPGNPTGDLDGATYTSSYVSNLVNTQVVPYYQRTSYGLTSLAVTATPQLYRMPQPSTYYINNSANDELHADAEAAAAVNYTLSDYDRIIVLFTRMNMAADTPSGPFVYGGLSDVGGPRTWINGRFTLGYVAHELGHSYGLYHANLWQVFDGNPISPDGSNTEYGDEFDIMGHGGVTQAEFNPWFKNLLGWLPNDRVQDVTVNGTYRIKRFDSGSVPSSGLLALRIRKDGHQNYWVGCRRTFTSNASMQHGAYIFWGENVATGSELLDMTTPGNNVQNAALAIGTTFTDATTNITIRPIAEGGSGVDQFIDIAVTVPVPGTTARMANLSTRLLAGTGENVGIGGFILQGTETKNILVRARGPSLASAGVTGVLADPVLELHDNSGNTIATNDDWIDNSNKQAIIDTGLAPSDDHEAALLLPLSPGLYTAIGYGAGSTTGVALVELYDVQPSADSRLANMSTRGSVQTGDNVMIGGIIIVGPDAKTVLVRAIGPSLASFGIQNPLQNPTLELRDSNGALITSNDDWQTDQRLDVEATGLKPNNDLESAIVQTLDPGLYTAIVRGSNNSTGVAVIEAYGLQ